MAPDDRLSATGKVGPPPSPEVQFPDVEPYGNSNRMCINGYLEPRYWREIEAGDNSGTWRSDGQPGPGLVVWVSANGLVVTGMRGTLRPGAARWLALRLAEGAGIYEANFGGDGSVPRHGGYRPSRQLETLRLPEPLQVQLEEDD